MKLNEILKLLRQVHTGDCVRYIDSLVEKCNGEYTMAIKRKSQDKIAILREFWGDDEGCIQPLDFGECDFLYTDKDGKTAPYPFTCNDLIANDWECFIYDCNGDYNYSALKGELQESFSQYLLDEWDEALLDYDSAIKKTKLLFSKIDGSEILRIDVSCVFSGNYNTLSGAMDTIKDWWLLDELKGQWKDSVFLIEIVMKNGEDFNLAEWEVDNA